MKKKIYLILFGFLIFSLSFTNLYAKTLKIVFGTMQECNAFCSSTCKTVDGGMEADGYMCQKDVLDSDKSKYPTKYSVSDTSVEVKKGAAVEITLTFEFEKEITEKKYDGKCFSVDNNIKVQKSSSTGNEISYKITGNNATPTGKNAEVKCIYAGQTNYLSKAISVKVTPAQTYNNMSDCNDCRDKCIVDGVFSVEKEDKSSVGMGTYTCSKITVDNLYVLNVNKQTKALKGDFLCGSSAAFQTVKYTCDDEYDLNNTEIDDSINFGTASITCEELLQGNAQLFVKLGIIVLREISPILLIALSAADFMKAISQQEEDAMVKAWKRFGTRCVIVVIIMLLPTILNILSTLLGIFDSCGIW